MRRNAPVRLAQTEARIGGKAGEDDDDDGSGQPLARIQQVRWASKALPACLCAVCVCARPHTGA